MVGIKRLLVGKLSSLELLLTTRLLVVRVGAYTTRERRKERKKNGRKLKKMREEEEKEEKNRKVRLWGEEMGFRVCF